MGIVGFEESCGEWAKGVPELRLVRQALLKSGSLALEAAEEEVQPRVPVGSLVSERGLGTADERG
jgi:hypothetical protein